MENKLIDSCLKLHSKDILNDVQLKNCQKLIGSEDSINFIKRKDKLERHIFHENREKKNGKVNDLLNKLTKLENNYDKVGVNREMLNSALNNLDRKIKKIITTEFKNKENLNYEDFLKQFNEINDKNNIKDKTSKKIITLEKKRDILNKKFSNISIGINVLIINVLVLVFLLLIKLFYF